MTEREFCYWLQGYLEVAEPENIGPAAVDRIKRHLAMVFTHSIDVDVPPEIGSNLDAIHAGLPGGLPYPLYQPPGGPTARC